MEPNDPNQGQRLPEFSKSKLPKGQKEKKADKKTKKQRKPKKVQSSMRLDKGKGDKRTAKNKRADTNVYLTIDDYLSNSTEIDVKRLQNESTQKIAVQTGGFRAGPAILNYSQDSFKK